MGNTRGHSDFPNEPIIKVRGPIIEAQLIETMLLLSINQQSLIATKANRLVRAAHGTAVAEFGTRRAQGVDEAVYGARAAYIGGCVATSGVIPEKEFGIPSVNTMIHSWVQLLTANMTHSANMRDVTPTTALLWLTHMTPSAPVFQTQ